MTQDEEFRWWVNIEKYLGCQITYTESRDFYNGARHFIEDLTNRNCNNIPLDFIFTWNKLSSIFTDSELKKLNNYYFMEELTKEHKHSINWEFIERIRSNEYLFSMFIRGSELYKYTPDAVKRKIQDCDESIRSVPIQALCFIRPIYDRLIATGFTTIGDLLDCTKEDIISKNLTYISKKFIKTCEPYGITFEWKNKISRELRSEMDFTEFGICKFMEDIKRRKRECTFGNKEYTNYSIEDFRVLWEVAYKYINAYDMNVLYKRYFSNTEKILSYTQLGNELKIKSWTAGNIVKQSLNVIILYELVQRCKSIDPSEESAGKRELISYKDPQSNSNNMNTYECRTREDMPTFYYTDIGARKFLKDLTTDDMEPLDDFTMAWSKLSNYVTPRQLEIITECYFPEDGEIKPMTKVAEKIGVCYTNVRNMKESTIRRIRTNQLLYSFFIYGMTLNKYTPEWFSSNIKDNDESFNDVSIRVLPLSTRAYNCLARYGINTLSELSGMTKEELRKVRNVGESSFNEILEKAAVYGIIIK